MSSRAYPLSIGDPNTRANILWIHGYSGSPDAFIPIAEKIATETNALVTLPLLPGHNTHEQDLLPYGFDDFLSALHPVAQKLSKTQKPLIIIGYSFGSYLAACVAEEFNPTALVFALTPFSLQFPMSLPGTRYAWALKSFWDKRLTKEDILEREGTFYYPNVPGTSLELIHEGNMRLKKILPRLSFPIMTIHNACDPLAAPQSGAAILALSGKNPANEKVVYPDGRHALFFRPNHDREEQALLAFLKKNI